MRQDFFLARHFSLDARTSTLRISRSPPALHRTSFRARRDKMGTYLGYVLEFAPVVEGDHRDSREVVEVRPARHVLHPVDRGRLSNDREMIKLRRTDCCSTAIAIERSAAAISSLQSLNK